VLLYQEIPHWRFAQTTTGAAAISLPGAIIYQEIPHWRFAQTTTGAAAISLPGAISMVVRQYAAGSQPLSQRRP
jgi:hypothetical protein